MTFKDLQRIVLSSENKPTAEDLPAMIQLMQRLRDKRFWWIGNSTEHTRRYKQSNGNCCFNHIIGLPKKNGEEKGFFDYQYSIYKSLFLPSFINFRSASPEEETKFKKLLLEAELKSQSKEGNIKQTHLGVLAQKSNELIHPFKVKHVWIKKATGLGITELLIRIMCWLCMKNDNYKNSQMVVVTGPNQDLAIKIIKRMKGLFEPHGITFDSKETVLNLNGCSIEAYPSNHLDSFRSLTFCVLLQYWTNKKGGRIFQNGAAGPPPSPSSSSPSSSSPSSAPFSSVSSSPPSSSPFSSSTVSMSTV